MGLENKGNDSNITYLSVIMGSFRQKVSADTPHAVKRMNANDVEVFELCHDTLIGRLVDINVSEPGEFGKQWNVVIQDMDTHDVFVVNLNQNSSSAGGFLNRIPNMDLGVDIELRAYFFTPKDAEKPKGFLSVYQAGKKLDSAYTRENPGDLPELEGKEVNGKTQWDGTKRNLFYEALVEAIRKQDTFIGIQKGEGSGTQAESEAETAQPSMEEVLPDNKNAEEAPIAYADEPERTTQVELEVTEQPLSPEQKTGVAPPEPQQPGLSNQEKTPPPAGDEAQDDLPF